MQWSMYRYYEPLYRYYEPLYRYMLICIDTFLYRMHVLVLAWSSIDTLDLVSIHRLVYRYSYMLYRYKWGYFKFLPRWSIVSIHENHVSIHSSKIVNFSHVFCPRIPRTTPFDVVSLYLPLIWSRGLLDILKIPFSPGDNHRPLLRPCSRLPKINLDKIRCLHN